MQSLDFYMQSLDQSSSGVDVQALPSISKENDQLLILSYQKKNI